MKTEKILEKLIRFNTVEDKENLKINKFLADFLMPLDFKIQQIKDKRTGRVNLLAKYNRNKKTFLTFSGHTDTVPASKFWACDPFKLTQKGHKFFGLGTTNMKGAIAVILAVVKQLDLGKLKKGINLVFTYGEEKDLSGIQNFLKKVKLKTKYIVLAEDTGLKPRVASKGAYALKIEFIGKEAHGSEANKGINAILLAQDFIVRVNKLFEKIKIQKDSLFEIPFATINIAKITGGDLINRVPAYCCLELEYRTINEKQGIKIYRAILKILRSMKCKFKISLNLQLQPMITKNKKFVNVIATLTQAKIYGGNGTTEWSFYNKYGYECIILGPGNDNAHEPNEYITKEQLDRGVEIYKKIIEKYCK